MGIVAGDRWWVSRWPNFKAFDDDDDDDDDDNRNTTPPCSNNFTFYQKTSYSKNGDIYIYIYNIVNLVVYFQREIYIYVYIYIYGCDL